MHSRKFEKILVRFDGVCRGNGIILKAILHIFKKYRFTDF